MKYNEYPYSTKNIYIISSVSYAVSLKCALHFFEIQQQLENIGFTIANPIEIFANKKEISYKYDAQDKLKKLVTCDWVYIMPDVSLRKGSNAEVKIILELDLKIILGVEELALVVSQYA